MTGTSIHFLETLETVITQRRDRPMDGSYTSSLFAAGTQRIAQKVGEEAVEVALAACSDGQDSVKNEAADLLYHLLVLLVDQQLSLTEVVGLLESRHAP